MVSYYNNYVYLGGKVPTLKTKSESLGGDPMIPYHPPPNPNIKKRYCHYVLITSEENGKNVEGDIDNVCRRTGISLSLEGPDN